MIPGDRDLNTVTAQEWVQTSPQGRETFIERQREQGAVAFRCLACGFPLAYGGQSCEACALLASQMRRPQ